MKHETHTYFFLPLSLSSGPISGALNKYFSSRAISFVGCLLAAIGVGLCYTATDVIQITLYIGVIQGFGIGLTYVQNNAITNQYFVKYRATANGISLSGGTIGAFVLSYVLKYAINYYTLQECFLIISAIILLTLPVCLLMKPFETKQIEDKIRHNDKIMNIATVYLKSYTVDGKMFTGSNGVAPLGAHFGRRESVMTEPIKTFGRKVVGAVKVLERRVSSACQNPVYVAHPQLVPHPHHLHSNLPQTVLSLNNNNEKVISTANTIVTFHQQATSESNEKQSHYPDGLYHNPYESHHGDDKKHSIHPAVSESEISTVKLIMKIVTNKLFILTALTHMAYFWGSITYNMIIVDLSLDKGIVMESAVNLINANAAGDLIGRLGSGWFMDNKIFPLRMLSMFASVGIGILLCATPYVSNYWIFIGVSAVIGFLSGLINILLNILFCKYVGSDKAALAFGLSAFFSGAATLARPMVVGSFRDGQGSYDGLLLSLGAVSILVGFLWVFEPCLRKRKEEDDYPETEVSDDSCHKDPNRDFPDNTSSTTEVYSYVEKC